mmetsp:Transcript_98533/g.287428  ORF Transcript_98533/g.287428 Transcript_98533/m.287428 type:complete len:225 (-) Transcript_98533:2657-3331(-)
MIGLRLDDARFSFFAVCCSCELCLPLLVLHLRPLLGLHRCLGLPALMGRARHGCRRCRLLGLGGCHSLSRLLAEQLLPSTCLLYCFRSLCLGGRRLRLLLPGCRNDLRRLCRVRCLLRLNGLLLCLGLLRLLGGHGSLRLCPFSAPPRARLRCRSRVRCRRGRRLPALGGGCEQMLLLGIRCLLLTRGPLHTVRLLNLMSGLIPGGSCLRQLCLFLAFSLCLRC